MKRTIRKFTLVEMLTVIAIIGILAAIVVPAVILARQRGLVTSAQSDIKSIMTALKQLDSDYGKALKKDGSSYKIGDKTASTSSDVATLTGDAYNAMIAELTVPKNSAFTSTHPVSVNKRKKVYLDPRKEFDPGAAYTGQTGTLWRDPWGNPYVIYIKVTRDDQLAIPSTGKTIPGNYAVYSFGPNATDDKGCNADLEDCIYSGESGNHKNHDDIASWQL